MATSIFDLSAHVASTTKDSIYIKWKVENAVHSQKDFIQGFEVRYQAVGSTVVQFSQRLEATINAYDITQLHENTFYDICVKAFVRLNSSALSLPPSPHASVAQDVCTKGTTATDSLAVALGSTFGAFLALGFIVFLVFLAKWQHSRKEHKQKLMTSVYDESRVQQLRGCDDDDDDPKDAFLVSGVQLPEDLALSELSGQSSEVSIALYADQLPDTMDSDGGTNVQPSSDASHSFADGLDRRHQPLQDIAQDWITVTPYQDQHHPINDSGKHSDLLRPPPIPGVILRPLPQPMGREPEQVKSGSSSADHPLSSIAGPPGYGDSDERRDGCLSNEDASDPSTAETASHRPLKSTASNLW